MTLHWDEPKYQHITAVERENRNLLVSFADNTRVSLATELLLPPDTYNPAWNNLSFNAYEIIVPTSAGEVEIPWTKIRLLTDKNFAKHWANTAEKQAEQVGLRLRELRQRRNLSSKEVAERAGITPQSLSRIERGHHDVVFTTLRKILAAMGYTLEDLVEVQLAPASLESLLKHLESVGLKREWVKQRILPKSLLDSFEVDSDNELLAEVAKHISRIFKWPVESILNFEPLMIDSTIAQVAKFKTQGRTQEIQANIYAFYAHFLSLIVLDATKHLQTLPLPTSAEEVRQTVLDRYKSLNFESLVRYIWSLGIPVIPLEDSGAFHGACWRISGRNIIVLKQITPYQSRWLFDLAHELAHIILHLSEDRAAVIEPEEITPFQDTKEEEEANDFADELLLFGRAYELAEMSAERAGGEIKYLKSAVLEVATAEHVPVDLLANYVAYVLSTANHINWWGTANKLQITNPTPSYLARQIFFEHMNLDQLNPFDRGLVMRAVSQE